MFLVATNDSDELNERGDPIGRGYCAETIAKFRETVHWLKRGSEMVQRIDWLVSDDDSEASFLRRWESEVRPVEHQDSLGKQFHHNRERE
jgi:hypothetical protein